MKKTMVRIVAGTAVALAVVVVAGGVASADQITPVPAPAASGTSIWLLPGVDLGSVLDPTVGIPAAALGPVDRLLAFVNG